MIFFLGGLKIKEKGILASSNFFTLIPITCEDAGYLVDEAVDCSDGNSTLRVLKCFNDFLWEKMGENVGENASIIFCGRNNC